MLGNPPDDHCKEYKSCSGSSLQGISCVCRKELSMSGSLFPEEYYHSTELLPCWLITCINLHCYSCGK